MQKTFTENDWAFVRNAALSGVTQADIAAALGCHSETLAIHFERKFKTTYYEFVQQRDARGRADLMLKMHAEAMGGNSTMLIWLGKNRLGQSDRAEISQHSEVTHSIVYFPANGHEILANGTDPALIPDCIDASYFAIPSTIATDDD